MLMQSHVFYDGRPLLTPPQSDLRMGRNAYHVISLPYQLKELHILVKSINEGTGCCRCIRGTLAPFGGDGFLGAKMTRDLTRRLLINRLSGDNFVPQ